MSLFIYSLLAQLVTAQAPATNITNSIESRVSTECKTCPYSLCTNIASYEGSQNVTFTCWTRGTVIDGDNTWLKSSDNCYVNQYDLTEYPEEYRDVLPYCGTASEREFYTKAPARTKYNTECNIMPWISSDNVHYHKYGKDLTVTCYSDDQDLIINDATWWKTTENCYLAQIGLTSKPDKSKLDACGPIPHLEVNHTDSTIDPDDRSLPVPLVSKTISQLEKRYLVNVTVGEDYALCHQEPLSNSTVLRRYPWEKEVWIQCLARDDNANVTDRYWSLTTDFCFIRSVDLWESPEGDNYRFPYCYRFV